MTDCRELYVKYAGDVYRFALFLCGNETEAEEIAAETFARAVTGKGPLVSATVKGYLLTIARNLHLESVRRRRHYAEFPREVLDSRPHPEHVVSQRTELEAVQVRLQAFPEVDRAALLLRADGLTYDEIAVALDISLAAAKVKVHRLRLKLIEWRASRQGIEI